MKFQEQEAASQFLRRRGGRVFGRGGLPLAVLALAFLGCKMPSETGESAPTVSVSSAAEAAAMNEYKALQDAMATTGRVARARYASILNNYPRTRAAYEANLDLARDDYTAIERKKGTARTNAPIAEASRDFLEFFAYGDHAHPPMPDLQERYRAEMQPLYFNAVKNVGTWQATIEYLKAYPDSPYAEQIENSIEAAILNPNAGWEAAEILAAYREVRPERVREKQLAAGVETNLFRRLSSGTPLETLQRFLQVFPASIYAQSVEGMIDDQLGHQITVYTDRRILESTVRERPGTVDAAQAEEMIRVLKAQEDAYQAARSRNSVDALVEFMEANPNSRYLTSAARQIEELKLRSLPSAQQSRLKAYRAEIEREMSAEEMSLKSYDSQIRSLSEQVQDLQQQSRATQTRSYDLAAEAREHRRQAQHDAQVIRRIQQAMNRDPDLKTELESRQNQRANHIQEANRLDEEAKKVDREAARLKTEAAEVESKLSALKKKALGVRVEVMAKRNRLHHEYLERLNEAWKASRG